MKIIIGFMQPYQALADQIKAYLATAGHELVSADGSTVLAISHEVARAVSEKAVDRGIIIDDFAQLPFMVATKYPHTMVAPVFNEYSAELTIEHNNSNIICLGAALTADPLTMELIKIYSQFTFDAGRHLVRTNMIEAMLPEGDQ